MTQRSDGFYQSFSKRLIESAQAKGFGSSRSNSLGIDATALSKAAGSSYQMARRYALGKAIPDYESIIRISDWLEVSPGWLLFGDPADYSRLPCAEDVFSIIEEVLIKSYPLLKESDSPNDIARFIVEVIYDASHLSSDKEMVTKVIDASISSAIRFSGDTHKKKAS